MTVPDEAHAYLVSTIYPALEKGRPNWDAPHTMSVVSKIHEIKDNNPDLDIDWDVVIVAGYAHDWGYSDLFEEGTPVQLDEVGKQKVFHMEIGARKIEELLKDSRFAFLSEQQKTRVVHLVSIHDYLDRITAIDEKILVEADTLGAIDVTKVKPTFNAASNARYMEKARAVRLPLFVTEYSRSEFERLAKERDEYYASHE